MDPTPAAEGSSPSSTLESTTRPSTQNTQPSTTEATQTTKPSTSKRPSGESPSATAQEDDSSPATLWQLLKYMLLVLLLFVLLWVQWWLRLILNQRARRSGTAKKRVLTAWRHSLRYAHALGQAPDKKLRKLAEKAKFSQHLPTQEELRQFDSYFHTSIEALQSRSVWKRIYARLILALY